MDIKDIDWKGMIGGIAPGLAAALGGPLAGVAVKVIADKVLGQPEASADDVAVALSTGALSVEQIVALRAAEQTLQVEMAKIDQAREGAFLADTQSAREQTVALAREDSRIAWAAPIISVVIVVGFFGCVIILMFFQRNWDERTANLLNVLFGALIPGFAGVTQYWLGSSAGSKRAGDAVRKIAEQQAAK